VPKEGSLELRLGGRLRTAVRVAGPDGKPVAGARVVPVQVRVKGGMPPRSSFPPPEVIADLLAATTDAIGLGEIKNVQSADVEAVWVEAPGFGRQGCELRAGAGGIQSITLKSAGRLIGRIEADDPSATRGLSVLAMTIPQKSDGQRTSGEGSATTSAEGSFEIAALAAGRLAFNVFPAPGSKLRPKLPSDLTIEPGKTTEVTIRMEGPSRLRTVAGRVVDRAGQPAQGATVFQSGDAPARTESVTEADGRFQLNGVVSRATFVFARKPGYRFSGLAVAPESKDITLTIHKVDEPAVLVRKTLPPLLPRGEEIALARHVVDPYAELVLKNGGEAEKIRTLEALARIEPERVLELIEKKVFNMPFFNSMLRLRVATGLMDDSID
jgi:Carboxypeptidase regulatory-like domain